MPHIGVKRFCASKRQHNSTDGQKHVPALCAQKFQRIDWIERCQDGGLLHDFNNSGECQHAKPQHDDRAEQLAHQASTKTLHRE